MADPVEQAEAVDVSKLFHVIYEKSTSPENRNLAAELAIPELIRALNGNGLKSIASNRDLDMNLRMQAIEAVIANPDFINEKNWAKNKYFTGEDSLFSSASTVKSVVLSSLTQKDSADGFLNWWLDFNTWEEMKNVGATLNPELVKKHREITEQAFLRSGLKNDREFCLMILKNKYEDPVFDRIPLEDSPEKFYSAYTRLFCAGGNFVKTWRSLVSTEPVDPGIWSEMMKLEREKVVAVTVPGKGNFLVRTDEVGEYSERWQTMVYTQVSNTFPVSSLDYQKLKLSMPAEVTGKDGKQYLLVKQHFEDRRHQTFAGCSIYINSTVLSKEVEKVAAITFIDGKDNKGHSTETDNLHWFATNALFDMDYRERAGLRALSQTYAGDVVANHNYPSATFEKAKGIVAKHNLEVIKPRQEKQLAGYSQGDAWQKILDNSQADHHNALSTLKALSGIYFHSQSDQIKADSFRLLDALYKATIDNFVVKGNDFLIKLFSDQGWLQFRLPSDVISYANAEKWENAALNYLEMYKSITDFPSNEVRDSLHGIAGYSYGGEDYHPHLSKETRAKGKVIYDAIIARQNQAATAELIKAKEKRTTVVALGAGQPKQAPVAKPPGTVRGGNCLGP